MLARLRILWVRVRDSLWFLPGVMTLLAANLALVMVRLERDGVIAPGHGADWLLGGGAEGARGVLSAIAGGLITVTGVVFSVTVVALQLASSQFTPRVLRNFTADRSNQVVLGVFIGTFTYTLLVLRVIQSEASPEGLFVPRVSVAIAVGLVLISIGFLIYFINHASRSIQVSVILERVTRQALRNVERLFPETIGRPDPLQANPEAVPAAEAAQVTAAESGYLQAVDGNALFDFGRSKQLVIRMDRRIGEYVLPGRSLASVWPAGRLEEDVQRMVRRAFVLGPERTPDQDVEFGIIEIADIAVKALSAGINDPTTAVHCIDRLGAILLALGSRHPPQDTRTKEGNIHFIAQHLSYERAVGLAFDQIRHFGSDNSMIMKKLLDTLSQLLELVPEERHAPLLAQMDAVTIDADRGVDSSIDRPDVLRVARRIGSEPERGRELGRRGESKED